MTEKESQHFTKNIIGQAVYVYVRVHCLPYYIIILYNYIILCYNITFRRVGVATVAVEKQ